MTEPAHDEDECTFLKNVTVPCQLPFTCLGELFNCLKAALRPGAGLIDLFTGAPETDAPLLPRRLGTSQPPPQLRM